LAFLLQHLLTDSAGRVPEKEAARYENQALTYAELDAQTNQLARALRQAGVQRGDRVGLFVHKSLASLVGVFGILKAGAAYVPLDPNAPAKRLAFITRNCDIRVIVSQVKKLGTLAEFLEEGSPLNVVLLTDEAGDGEETALDGAACISWAAIRAQDPAPLAPVGVIETDLAYILYTSGSTGDPKGVMISHRTIFTFIQWCRDTFHVTAEDRITSHAPLHFDLSTFDIYVTIQAGGTIILVPEKLSIFPIRLVKLLQDERVTMTYMVPSILSLMVNYGKLEAHDLSALRFVLFAGEVFPIKYLRRLINLIQHPRYFNLYGPTETNVCTYYEVQEQDILPDETRPVPIGIACENMEIFVVDDDGGLVTEVGQEGELWARGSCVAQGYWGDPEKTALRFVPNPYQPDFHEIAYRTGDIVTLDEDGKNWRFIGRRDHMIKSRGYRIELGEIESAMYTHQGIKEAAVIAIPDPIVGNRLKAYVVQHKESALTVRDVQNHCLNHVPRYMVPEQIVFVDSLPKTSTGKVNRPLLQEMDAESDHSP
jgi:amino acid adenylation domain-containing protein